VIQPEQARQRDGLQPFRERVGEILHMKEPLCAGR
jgi:hypothetical protein